MRVTSHQFGANALGDIVERELTGLFSQLGVQHDLHHQVAQLLTELGRIASGDGLQHLVCLFQQMRAQALMRLRVVPGAAVYRISQSIDHAAHAVRRVANIGQLHLIKDHGSVPRAFVVHELRHC